MNLVMGGSLIQKAMHHKVFSKLNLPSVALLALATSLVGCSPQRPRVDAVVGDAITGPSIQLSANTTARGAHFYFDTLTATFSQPGKYTIVDPAVNQRWSVTIESNKVNQAIPLKYGSTRFLCVDRSRGNNNNFTIMRTASGEEPQIGMAAFKLTPP
jgi:hypothetical protein